MSQLRRRSLCTADSGGIKLPAGYTKLNSVYKGGGWSWVDFAPSYPILVKMSIAPNLSVISGSNPVTILGRNGSLGVETKNTGVLNFGGLSEASVFQDNVRIELELVMSTNKAQTRIAIDGGIPVYVSSTPNYSDKLLFGAGWTNGTYVSQFVLYDFEMYSYDTSTGGAGELTHKLVPCIRESTLTYGVYDVITNTFTGSSGWKASRPS